MKFFKNIVLIAVLCIIGSVNAKVADLIMALDPTRNETIESTSRAMVGLVNNALIEKIAPIITTSNIFEIIVDVQSKLGNDNIQKLRNLIQTSNNSRSVNDLTEQLKQSYNIKTFGRLVALISLVNLNNKDFNCYLHNSENLVLIIPKQYIQTHFPNAIQLSPSEQAKLCGFNPTITTEITDFNTESILQKLRSQQTHPIHQEQFIPHLTELFTPNKDIKWVIHLAGHGGPAQSAEEIRTRLAQCKESLAFWQKQLVSNRTDQNLDSVIFYDSIIKHYEQILAHSGNLAIIPETAHIAGLSLKEFSQLMQFFDKNINTGFLHYSTCFGGGYNQTFLNEILSSLNVNFIVSSEGIDERSNTGISALIQLIPNKSGTGLILNRQPFTDFFKLLNLFIDKPEDFIKIKGEKKEPVAQILRTIAPILEEEQAFNEVNQPFVRFPAVGIFGAISIDKNIKILTNVIVKAHEIEKKPIDLSNTNMRVIVVNPSRINVLLNLGKEGTNGHPVIALPNTKNIPSTYEAIHTFKEINSETTFQIFLFHCIYLNARMHTQTLIIQKLTGISEESNLSIQPGTENTIHNLIIQIKGILGTGRINESSSISKPLTAKDILSDEMGANINICFELNGNIYQQTISIQKFADIDAVYDTISELSFTPEPIQKVNMEALANRFMPQQEVTKLKKPITLETIAQHLDSKIDTQQTSITKDTQSQSGAINLSNELISNFLRAKPKYSSKIKF